MPSLYLPYDQTFSDKFYVRVCTTQSCKPSPSIVQAHRIDRGLIADGEETMSDRIDNSQSAYLHRSASWSVTALAALAPAWALGLYGVIAYTFCQRKSISSKGLS
jgi:macrolide transport system ATP-binding/permease protein